MSELLGKKINLIEVFPILINERVSRKMKIKIVILVGEST